MNGTTRRTTQAERDVAVESAIGNAKRIRDNTQEPQTEYSADNIVKSLENGHADPVAIAVRIRDNTTEPSTERLADNIIRNMKIVDSA